MRLGANGKVANNLLALSSAAVLAVYAAGYVRTRPFASAFDNETAERRPASPSTPRRITPPAQRRAPKPVLGAVAAAPADSSPPNPVAQLTAQTPAQTPASFWTDDATSSLLNRPATSQPATPASAPEPESVPAPAAPPSSPAPASLPALTPPPVAPTPRLVTAAPAPAPVTIIAPRRIVAPPPAPVTPVVAAPAARPRWRDGVYFGWGYSRHGDILARVEIDEGRIISATISECKTRYSCSDIDKLPPQIIARQSVDVDSVTGATESADAFTQGVFEALGQAK